MAQQWYCNIQGQQYGPVELETLQQWADQRRLGPSDLVWGEGMPQWQQAQTVAGLSFPAGPAVPPPAPTGAQPTSPVPGQAVEPHRGVMILIFGILGVLCCVIFGIIAWVMGSGDLRKMERGLMDRSGEGMTRAGQIIGIVATILFILGGIVSGLSVLGAGHWPRHLPRPFFW